MVKALIVVDVQNDFCPGGSLAVENGDKVASDISLYIKEHRSEYPVIVATRDWHIDPKEHFASSQGGVPNYVTTWPDHCIAGTDGAEYHPNLFLPPETVHFKKGEHEAAYSGFEGSVYDPFSDENVSLETYFKLCDVDKVDIVGIATDFCVKATAADAASIGFDTTIILPLTAAVSPENLELTIQQLDALGVQTV